MKLFAILVLLTMAVPSVAFADGENSPEQKPCHTKKKHKKVAPKATECPLPVEQPACDCPAGPEGPEGAEGPRGAKGFRGFQGDKGEKGDTKYASIYPGIGYFGIGLWPKHDYAWAQGIELRFQSLLNAQNTLDFGLGLAPGHDGAVLVRTGITHWYQTKVLGFQPGAYVGVVGMVIGLNDNLENGYYVGLSPQLRLARWFGDLGLTVEAGPVLGLAKFETTDTDVVGGVMASAGLSWNW